MELMNAHRQWATRAPEERFVSLDDLCNAQEYKRQHSMRKVMANRDLTVVPIDNETWDVGIQGPQGNVARFTHWGFNLTISYLSSRHRRCASTSETLPDYEM